MDIKLLTISDIIKHPRFGILSYQPIPCQEIQEDGIIRTINSKQRLVFVNVAECDPVPEEDKNFWEELNENKKD